MRGNQNYSFEGVTPPNSQRAYVQGGRHRNGYIDGNIQGSGFGQFASDLGNAAYGVGAIASVIDNWGAGKRAAKDESLNKAFEQASYIPDDKVGELLQDPSQLEAFAQGSNLTADEWRGVLTRRQSSLNPQVQQVQIFDNMMSVDEPYFDDPANQAAMAQEQEQVPVQEGEVAQGQVPQEEAPVPDAATAEAQGGLAPYDPVEMERMVQEQAILEEAIAEEATIPTTYDEMEAEATRLSAYVPANPSPEVLQAAQKNLTQAIMNDVKYQKVFNSIIAYQMSQGQQVNAEQAAQIAAAKTQPVEAKREAIRKYGIVNNDYVPHEYRKYFDNPDYYDAAVDIARARMDRKFRDSLSAEELASLNRLNSQLPPVWKNIYGTAIQATAKIQMDQDIVERNTKVAERGADLAEKTEENSFKIRSQTLGLEEKKFEVLKTKTMRELGWGDKRVELEIRKVAEEQLQADRKWKLDTIGTEHTLALSRADLATRAFTNANAAYGVLKDLGNVPQKSEGATMLIQLLQEEVKLAKISADASGAKAGLSGLDADMAGAVPDAADVKLLQQSIKAKREELVRRYAASGLDLYVSQGEMMQVDVTKDLKTLRNEIFGALGYGQDAYLRGAKDLDSLSSRLMVDPDRLGSAYVPPKLEAAMNAAEDAGMQLQIYESVDSFRLALRRHGIRPKDVESLHALWNTRAMEQRQRQRDDVISRGIEGQT